MSYLHSHDLLTLCFVSKYHRNDVLSTNKKIYHLSSGFCSIKYWDEILANNAFKLLHKIYEKIETFDFEKYYLKLYKRYRHHLSLFSVCLHFVTCYRSCDKIGTYCRYCSRVRAGDFNPYQKKIDIVVCVDKEINFRNDFLYMHERLLDLDVFLERPVYFDFPHYPLKKIHVIIFKYSIFHKICLLALLLC